MTVFAIRYFDFFYKFISIYNFLFKVGFLSLTAYTIYLMRFAKPFNSVCDHNRLNNM